MSLNGTRPPFAVNESLVLDRIAKNRQGKHQHTYTDATDDQCRISARRRRQRRRNWHEAKDYHLQYVRHVNSAARSPDGIKEAKCSGSCDKQEHSPDNPVGAGVVEEQQAEWHRVDPTDNEEQRCSARSENHCRVDVAGSPRIQCDIAG